MKAYIAHDKNHDEPLALIVFAESPGMAKAYAANCDGFDCYGFTDIRVKRCPNLDKFYRRKEEGE